MPVGSRKWWFGGDVDVVVNQMIHLVVNACHHLLCHHLVVVVSEKVWEKDHHHVKVW